MTPITLEQACYLVGNSASLASVPDAIQACVANAVMIAVATDVKREHLDAIVAEQWKNAIETKKAATEGAPKK